MTGLKLLLGFALLTVAGCAESGSPIDNTNQTDGTPNLAVVADPDDPSRKAVRISGSDTFHVIPSIPSGVRTRGLKVYQRDVGSTTWSNLRNWTSCMEEGPFVLAGNSREWLLVHYSSTGYCPDTDPFTGVKFDSVQTRVFRDGWAVTVQTPTSIDSEVILPSN